MGKLITPFGEIDIMIDGQPVSYTAREGNKIKESCPDVLGRFQIPVHYIPDGKEHSIACVFIPGCPYERTQESGERLECQSFYNDRGFKMSVGISWIDDVDRTDPGDGNHNRDIQTWFGADPAVSL